MVLSMVPFAYFEELVECYTGQRYARLCTPLRSKVTHPPSSPGCPPIEPAPHLSSPRCPRGLQSAVFFKDAPGLATDVAPALVEAADDHGDVDLCVVRPRSTQETSDVYLVFSDSDDAGMAASHMDGKTFASWKANALRRK